MVEEEEMQTGNQEVILRSIRDIVEDLSQPIEDKYLKTKEARNRKENTTQQLLYIPWFNAVAILDDLAPGWFYEIRSAFQLETNLVMIARITIPCLEGLVFREASSLEPILGTGFGDAATNAESAALRRAAAKFGLGLYLYDKDVARNAVRQFTRSRGQSQNQGARTSGPGPQRQQAGNPPPSTTSNRPPASNVGGQEGKSQVGNEASGKPKATATGKPKTATDFWGLQRSEGIDKTRAQEIANMHPNDWPAAYAKLESMVQRKAA